MELRELIERAAAKAGTHTALAKALGVTPQRMNEWKQGTRTCPLHAQAQIAELAGEDAKEWVWRAVCHQLGRVTAAVLLTLAASLAAIGAHGVGGSGWLASRRA